LCNWGLGIISGTGGPVIRVSPHPGWLFFRFECLGSTVL
jgi:hypothetical protein